MQASSTAACPIFDPIHRVRARELDRRQHAKHEARAHADHQQRGDHVPTHREVKPVGPLGHRHREHPETEPDEAETSSKDTSENGEDKTLHEQLPENVPAGRAERRADGDFA